MDGAFPFLLAIVTVSALWGNVGVKLDEFVKQQHEGYGEGYISSSIDREQGVDLRWFLPIPFMQLVSLMVNRDSVYMQRYGTGHYLSMVSELTHGVKGLVPPN